MHAQELLQFELGAASSMGDAVAPEILAASAELASATVGKPAGARADGAAAGSGVEKAGIAATGMTWPRFSLCATLRFNVCRCGRGALRRGTTLACFGLQFRFALWFSVNCWMYARDERVEPTPRVHRDVQDLFN